MRTGVNRSRILRAALLTVIVGCCPSLVSAQAASSDEESETLASDQSASDQDASSGAHLEEIVVTAQRRGENLQRVPIAITAVTADAAQQMGLTGTLGLQIAAPAVTFNQSPGGGSAITMRGVVGTGTVADESPTSVYIDGVYLAGTPGLYFNLNNIERIEVLKGPQGTLFGRNSVGGSIQIITRTPQYQPEASISLSYGNYDTVEAQAYLTGGITDNLAVDLALYGQHQSDGWGINIATGGEIYKADQKAVRGKVLWEPTPDTHIVGGVSYSRVELPALQGRAIYVGRLNLTGLSQEDIGFYNTDETFDGSGYSEQTTASLNIRHDFGPVTFVSISGYEDTKSVLLADQDGSRVSVLNVRGGPIIVESYSQEFQLLSSEPSWLEWIVGAYYFHADNKVQTLATANPLSNPTTFTTVDTNAPVDSYAAFGQATVEILPGTKLTGGLRYTLDERSLSGFTGNQSTQTPVPYRERKDDKITYRIALSHQVTDEVMLFGSVSTGFKSGLFPAASPTGPVALPSLLTAYELGFKADLFDRILRLNASIFYNKFDDVQVRIRNPENTGNIFINATDSEAKGVDLDFTLIASERLSFRGGLAYLDSTYGSFTNASCYFPRPNNIGNINTVCDATGKDTINSPEFTATIAATYEIETSIGLFSITGSETHNSGFFFDPQNRVKNESFDRVNLSASWTPTSQVLTVQLWMRNLLKEKYYTAAQISNQGDLMSVSDPRTYGITLKADF